jgi:hypothetical protein
LPSVARSASRCSRPSPRMCTTVTP